MSEGRQQLSKALLDSAPQATLLTDIAGRIVRVNQLAEVLLGYAELDLVGRSVKQLLPRDRHTEFDRHLSAFAQDPERQVIGENLDLVALRRDGTTFSVEVSVNPIETLSGLFVVAALRDVTDRRLQVEALRATAERFRDAFDYAPIGLAICRPDGRFVQVNAALCEITGYRQDELRRTTLPAIVHPDDASGTDELFGGLLSDESDFHQHDQRCMRASGEPVWTSLHAVAIRGPDGVLQQVVVQLVDTSERRRLEGELQHLADHDPLTGLLNRQGLEEELDRHVAYVNRYGARGALLVLDVDHFKAINDTLGHEAGDRVICAVADRLSRRLRSSDLLARLGGDEFAILLPEADVGAARRVAAAILSDVRDRPVPVSNDAERGVTVSVGVTMFRQDAAGGEEALVEADLAMYDSKEAGRDRVSVCARGQREEPLIKARLAWVDRIRAALADDRMTLFAQPIVGLASTEREAGTIRQHELLLRMLDDAGEVIPPSAFLPIAERYDLITEIDSWVVREAVRLVQRQPGGVQRGVEINVSARSLTDDALLELIQGELLRSRIDPALLTFELTETAAIANVRLARSFAEGLAELGCRFALDDFGSGFGSFYYLKHIPFDFLKIGREFVTGCLGNRTDQLVIESLVSIARGLTKQTIAVGVEDIRTATFLRRSGVDLAQGFHFGRPYQVLRTDREAARPLRTR